MKTIVLYLVILLVYPGMQTWAQSAPVSSLGNVTSNTYMAEVPITVTNFTNIAAFNLDIQYNPAIASVMNVTTGPSFSASVNWTTNSNYGHLGISFSQWPAVSIADDSILIIITFNKVSNGTTDLIWYDPSPPSYGCIFSNSELYFLTDIPTSDYYINGSLTFTGTQHAPVTTSPSLSGCPESQIDVPITVDYFDDIGGVSLAMTYDTNALTYIGSVNNSGFPLTISETDVPGGVSIRGYIPASDPGISLTNGESLCSLQFYYLGGTTTLIWADTCKYTQPYPYDTLDDIPFSLYFINGSISELETPEAGDGGVIFPGNSIELNGTTNNTGSYTYYWSPGNSLDDSTVMNPVAAPITTTTYKLYVSGANGCMKYDSLIVTVIAPTDTVFSGKVIYAGNSHPPIANVQVGLYKNDSAYFTCMTNALGNYYFTNIQPGDYRIKAKTNNSWGGVNSTDALLMAKHYVQSIQLSGIFWQAADVNKSFFVNSNDALLTMRRFVALINTFAAGDWLFDSANVSIPGSIVNYNINGLCVGDVNGSRINPNIKPAAEVRLETHGLLEPELESGFIVPIITATEITAGAISLVINYPDDLLDITGVHIGLDQENLCFKAENGQLRIGWFSMTGFTCRQGMPIIQLNVQMHQALTNPQILSFSLNGEESQIADETGSPIPDHILIIPAIKGQKSDQGLLMNYPNPLNSNTTFSFTLPEKGMVSITLFNAAGEQLNLGVASRKMTQSINTIDFDASPLPCGLYYYRLEFTGPVHQFHKMGKMIIAR